MPDTEPSPTSPEQPKSKTSILVWFAAHPIVGFVGTVASVLGVVLAVVFYLAAIRTRELSLYVNPAKTTIVKSGQSSDLHILYKGKDVPTDVTALQVELWNAGKESIRPEQVLLPITLETTPRVPILEVRIRHISRPLTQVVLDQTHIANGKVTVSWKILEHNDGAVIQFILAGPSKTSIKASGALEGQSRVKVLQFTLKEHPLIILVIAALFIGPLMIVFQLRYFKWAEKHLEVSTPVFVLILLVSVMLFAALGALALHYYFGAPSIPIQFD
jgi:hypothetical protein